MASNINVVRRQIELLKTSTLSPQAFVKMHAATARSERGKLEAEQGKYPTTVVVDGRQGASEDSVRYGGVIEYEFHPAGDVIDATYAALMEAAPVKTGSYAKHILMYVNRVRRDATAEGATVDIKAGDEVVFIDTVPYARKIEGWRGRRNQSRPGLSAQAPNGVFEITARAMKARFGNYPVKIDFDYRAVLDGGVAESGPAKSAVRGKKGRFVSTGGTQSANRSENRWPCLIIEVL
ncbi:hypothetical protein E6C67_08405 [Azospirillum sp. TSA2s]|uniref:hypothetical protein n=1 Tax=Azospirillum sp. TSA2s TaxID=709810 RepID=UPI0010AA78AE|nr:hypothetical protein [Azospirillum sp. TSA2s]QCG93960.1 hypothetical protein E6C67_08405 [Azospirillum sp. TSA2s]